MNLGLLRSYESFVLQAWAKDQGVEGSLLTFYGDPTGAFTKACDMEMNHPGPIGKGLLGRCKRFALYVDDGTVKYATIAEDPEFDPAGDDFPEKVLAGAIVDAIKESK